MGSRRIVNRHLPQLLLLVAGSLLVIGLVIVLQQAVDNHRAQAAAQKAIALANAGKPSPAPATIKPSQQAVASYSVPPSRPRYLIIPTLAVKARILPVGLTKSNAIGSPANVYDTAWYNASSLPGRPGAMLVDGHVSSWTTHGVFYAIKNLTKGDVIKVERGDGATYSYTVVKSQVYASNNIDSATLLAPINKNAPGLNLVTCAGDVIKGTNEFNKRIVVYATLD